MDLKTQILEHPRNTAIDFDEINHIYTFKETGELFKGVTDLIEQFKKPFDSDAVASKKTNTLEEKKLLLAQWENNRKQATQYGTNVHKAIEQYLMTGEIDFEYENEQKKAKELLDNLGLKFIAAEFLIWSNEIKRASSIDILCEKDQKLVIVDSKTMKKEIEYMSFKSAKMKYPLHDVLDCKFYHQSLQVGIYKKILEKEYNMPVSNENYILHINQPSNIGLTIPIFDLEDEISNLFEYIKRKNRYDGAKYDTKRI